MRRTYSVLAALLVTVTAFVAVAVTSGSAKTTTPRTTHARAAHTYLDRSAPIGARVADLLGQMTLQEKIGQMDEIVLGFLRGPTNPANGVCNGGNSDQLQTNCLQKVLITDKTGSILSGATDNPPDNTGTGWANLYNTIQHYAIDHSRLHIPIIYGVDAVHGFGHPTAATLFPQSIGMGATWDTQLAPFSAVRDLYLSPLWPGWLDCE